MLVTLDLNEINFEMISEYAREGRLPNFSELLTKHKVYETTSEVLYEEWEPWIQWVTAQTGLTLEEHGVFRLGDIVKTDYPQIWEILAQRGHKVCAISPMNAVNRLHQPHVFVPDPWTSTPVTGPEEIERLAAAVADLVNGNVAGTSSRESYLNFARGLIRFSRVENYGEYLNLIAKSKSKKWLKALLLDLLLADVLISMIKSRKFAYASLFLNAGAHIQHHYMFSSSLYTGPFSNPISVVPDGADPVYDAYRLYDRVIGQIRRVAPETRLILRTGLHQVPHQEETYYWRLKHHDDFLRRVGLDFKAISPRMSRDFVVEFSSQEQAAEFAQKISLFRDIEGNCMFSTDLRDNDMFIELVFEKEVTFSTQYYFGNEIKTDLHESVAFVALKNGKHSGIGYFVDTGLSTDPWPSGQFPLKNVFSHILDIMDGTGDRRVNAHSTGSAA
jgi:hypothetical protein